MKSPLATSLVLLTLAFGPSVSSPAAEETKAAVMELKPADALKGIPRDVLGDLRPGSRKLVDAAAKASQVVATNIENKTVTMKFTVSGIEKFQRPDAPTINRYRVRSNPDTEREGGTTFYVNVMVVPDVSDDEKVAKLKKGDKVTFTGRVSNGEITAAGSVVLHIDLMDAKLK